MSAAWAMAMRSSTGIATSGRRRRARRFSRPSIWVCSATDVVHARPSGHRPVTGTGASNASTDARSATANHIPSRQRSKTPAARPLTGPRPLSAGASNRLRSSSTGHMPSYDLLVNGERRTVEVTPDMPLLWVLRDILNFAGTKFGCGAGLCGACACSSRRPAGALLLSSAARGGEPRHHDHRRVVGGRFASAAACLGGRRRAPVRLLPGRPDHERGGAACEEPQPERCRDRCGDGGEPLPLRDVSPGSAVPSTAPRSWARSAPRCDDEPASHPPAGTRSHSRRAVHVRVAGGDPRGAAVDAAHVPARDAVGRRRAARCGGDAADAGGAAGHGAVRRVPAARPAARRSRRHRHDLGVEPRHGRRHQDLAADDGGRGSVATPTGPACAW